jgi:transmembrane sensor
MTESAADEALLAEARAWARKLAVGRPTTADAQALRGWCGQSPAHAAAWRRASAEWREMGTVLAAHRAAHPEPARPSARASRRNGRRLFLAGGGAFATAVGAVALLHPPLGLWPSWAELGADYRTATGEQREVEVGPHIRLALNTQTSVALRGGARQAPSVELIAGEAAVRTDGAALDVLARNGRVHLADGAVEVRCLPEGGAVRVVCTEGRAEVRHASGTATLVAGQQVRYDAQRLHTPVQRDQAQSDWRQGVVVFRDTPLDEAIAEINRYRPGRVMLMSDALARQRISGRFAIGSMDQALVLIERLYRAQVRQVGDLVLLT